MVPRVAPVGTVSKPAMASLGGVARGSVPFEGTKDWSSMAGGDGCVSLSVVAGRTTSTLWLWLEGFADSFLDRHGCSVVGDWTYLAS